MPDDFVGLIPGGVTGSPPKDATTEGDISFSMSTAATTGAESIPCTPTPATSSVAGDSAIVSTSPPLSAAGDVQTAGSGGEDTGDEVEGYCLDGEVLAGAVSTSITGSIPSLAELNLKEDVYAILSSQSLVFLVNG